MLCYVVCGMNFYSLTNLCVLLLDVTGWFRFSPMQANSYGVTQKNPDAPENSLEYTKWKRTMFEMEEYMTKTVPNDVVLSRVSSQCKNAHELCAFWAGVGECDVNPGYMLINCGPACASCSQLDINTRCSFTPDEYPDAYGPGDMDDMFYSIANGMWDELKPVIHSAPEDYHEKRFHNTSSVMDHSNVFVGGPWIVTFEEFLSEAEADRLVELGYAEGFERSTDVGHKKVDGTHENKISTGRTSENAWCLSDTCVNDEINTIVSDRIANVTRIPVSYSENFQILRYEENQRYHRHHDYIPHHKNLPGGVRSLTFFLYLSNVEEGGETRFNNLNVDDITPKKGKALLWPSTLNHKPNLPDYRTHHEAMRVIKGKKYAANLWIHNREFRRAHAVGCTG